MKMTARKLTRKDLAETAEKYKNWGRWGPDGEIGALNHTSPEDIVAAARLVRKGKVISLALNFDQHGPQGAKSKYPSMGRVNPVHTMLRTGTDAYRVHRRPRSEDEVSQGLSGSRRRTGLRDGDEVERDRRCGGAHPRHAAAGVSHRAHRCARPGAPGPVHLQFRGNEDQIDQEETDLEPLCEPRFAQLPPFRPEADAASLREALVFLQQAQKPVIVAGGGVRASGARRELVALAEKLQIPVATSLNGKDSIRASHPLSVGVVGTYSRESANRVVALADLVFFVGTEAGGMTTHFWTVPRIGVAAVQIDIDPDALGRNYPLQAALNGDATATLARMLALRLLRFHRVPRRVIQPGLSI